MYGPVKCLLVDDLEENLLSLAALLRQDGVELLQARSATEALELLLLHEDVALAIIDVQMPETDGFELAELIRGSQRTCRVPLIFVTAGTHDPRRVFRGYESGAVDFLYKPLDARILKNKADVFFQLHRHRRQLAKELRERSETLRLNELFVAMLGHDLRNPLAALMAMAQALQTRADDPALVQKAAARIQTSGRRMSRMIDDMFDLARVRLGEGIALQAGPAELRAVVGRVVDEHRAAGPGRRIAFSCQGDTRGLWDVERLGRVASNLIGNALQHGSGACPVDVQLDGTREGEVRLTVSNAGEIPADILPGLFDAFRRGGTSGSGGGLGLGLYIVQQIVLAHGGSVTARSSAERTAFDVMLPRRVVVAAAAADAA